MAKCGKKSPVKKTLAVGRAPAGKFLATDKVTPDFLKGVTKKTVKAFGKPCK